MALSRITNYIEADGADLNLQSSDTTITDGSVLGVINFKAPSEASGTDAILLASKIVGVISGNPVVVGDCAWNRWEGKFVKDDYNRYVREELHQYHLPHLVL